MIAWIHSLCVVFLVCWLLHFIPWYVLVVLLVLGLTGMGEE